MEEKRAKLIVSLELMRHQLELPSDVQIVGVTSGEHLAILTLEGPAELFPDTEFVNAEFTRKPLFDRFTPAETIPGLFPDLKG